MNNFPFFEPVDDTVIKAITNLKKEEFAGAMPFIYFHEHNGDPKTKVQLTIGTETSYRYDSKEMGKYRFPPLITNLEVKPTGTMGVVREGEVTVKFASMAQLKDYQNFFRIGSAKTIVWGWNQDRVTGKDTKDIPITDNFSREFVGKIKYWKKWMASKNHSVDIMVGPLINFNFTINNDASVDVVFTVGCPTELTAYLGSHKQDSKATKTGDTDSKSSYEVGDLLGLNDTEYSSLLNKELLPNLINYYYSTSNVSQWWSNILSSFGQEYDSISEDAYIAFYLIAKYTINQRSDGGKSGRYKFDLDDSITCAHPNMISNSENVIFLNKQMANPISTGKETILDIGNPQNFDHKLQSKSYPEEQDYNLRGNANFIPKLRWGKTQNIFFKVKFVQDIIKNNGDGNIFNILEQLCNEINLATCGLTDVAPQTSSNPAGFETFTIVDYALTPTNATAPLLPLFENGNLSSTITNISFNCDLPKEIAAMAMMGNRKTIDSGANLFFSYEKDAVLEAPGTGSYGAISSGSNSSVTGSASVLCGPMPTTKLPKGKIYSPYIYVTQGGITNCRWEIIDIGKIATTKLINEACIVIPNNTTEHTVGANNQGVTKAIFKNTDIIKAMYFGDPGLNKNNPLLPIELELTVLGIAGITCGQVLRIDNLPFNNNGIFQVKEVNHTVNTLWETNIKLGFRPENEPPK
jgi:hypothetical protein